MGINNALTNDEFYRKIAHSRKTTFFYWEIKLKIKKFIKKNESKIVQNHSKKILIYNMQDQPSNFVHSTSTPLFSHFCDFAIENQT